MAVRRPAPKAAAPVAPAAKAAPAPVEKPVVAAAPAAAPAPAAEKPVAAATVIEVSAFEANLRNAAVKALEQGRAAYDQVKAATDEATQALEATVAASSKGASELATKAFEAAKTNANATFDHMQALASSKTVAEAIALHGQFLRAQADTVIAQAKEFGELAKQAASEAGAPLQAQIKKTLHKA